MAPRIQAGRISVVIATYNRYDDVRTALQSIVAQDYEDIEIIVVDNASNDGTLAMLQSEFGSAHIISLNENIGMDGYSVGFRAATGEFIFQMDSDGFLSSNTTLSSFVNRFQKGPPDMAVVVARVEECSGHKDFSELFNCDKRRGPIRTDGFHGAITFRADMLHSVGYYNRDVFLYGSELFLLMKLYAKGYQIYYYPEIMVLHKSSAAGRYSHDNFYEMRNRYWFFRRFASRKQQMRYIPALLVHDLAYAIFRRSLRTYYRVLKEGLGPMPGSLLPPLHSDQAEFLKTISKIGQEINLISTAKLCIKRL